jgi:hypothetical protein
MYTLFPLQYNKVEPSGLVDMTSGRPRTVRGKEANVFTKIPFLTNKIKLTVDDIFTHNGTFRARVELPETIIEKIVMLLKSTLNILEKYA